VAATAADIAAISSATGGGSAQAQTVSLTPAVTTLTDNLSACWVPAAANTGASPTLQINSTPPYPIVKNGNTALAAADIDPPAKACVLFDLANSRFQLQNPQTVASGGTGGGSSVTAGDNLSNASGTFNWVPFDPTTAWGRDEFCGGTDNTPGAAQYGELGWYNTSDNYDNPATYINGVQNHPCILHVATTANLYGNNYLALISIDKVQQFPPMNASTYDYEFIFRLNTTANTYLALGLTGDVYGTHFSGTNEIGLRYFTGDPVGTHWQFKSCASSTCTSTDTGVAVDTNWHRLKISATSGTPTICMDACASPVSVPTAPSVSVHPEAVIQTYAALATSFDIDYFSYAFRGLSRW
jgi:hypothetical protein